MSKKQWIITAAVVLAIVAVMSVFCFPRKASRVLDLPTEMPVSIWGEVLRDLEEPQSFRTRDTDQIAEAEALLEHDRLADRVAVARLDYYNVVDREIGLHTARKDGRHTDTERHRQ